MPDDLLGENPIEKLRELHCLLDKNPEEVYRKISQVGSLDNYDANIAIDILGLLIDSAGDTGNLEGLEKAIDQAKKLLEQNLKQVYTIFISCLIYK